MRISTICTATGALFFLWLFGLLDFAPKLWADVSKWQGADGAEKAIKSSLKAFSDNWEKKIGGEAKAISSTASKKLGDDICLPNTTNTDAKLSKADYGKHISQVNLKTKSILQVPNSSVFCYYQKNRSSFVYSPEWEPTKFLIIDAITGSETILDLSDEPTK